MRQIALSPAELREDLKSETARATRLEQQLRHARAEIRGVEAARDAAIKIAAWGGQRRTAGGTRHEH